jgi:hypothetical protein
MRWRRKGILIRLAIYVPIIGFLTWTTCANRRARQDAADAAAGEDAAKRELEQHKRSYTMPDGTKQDVYELTPEQAERLLGKPAAFPDAEPTGGPDAPTDAEPAKSLKSP